MNNNKAEKILQAAEKVFFTKGFFPARMEDIAEMAGVAKGTLYLYFRDKTSIYIHLLNQRLQEAIKILETMQNAKISATEKLARIFDTWAHYYSQVKGVTSFISVENINLTTEIMQEVDQQIKPKLAKFVKIVAKIIQDGIAQKEFKKINPKIGAIFFLNTVRAIFISRLYNIDARQSTEGIKELLFAGLKLTDKKKESE